MSRRLASLCAVLAAAAAALSVAPLAEASFPTVYGGTLTCVAQPANGNVRLCGGPTTTADGRMVSMLRVIFSMTMLCSTSPTWKSSKPRVETPHS